MRRLVIDLADRILVLKQHPGEVLELIEVPVPRPRSSNQFTSAEFLATKARLDALIHPQIDELPEAHEDDETEQNKLYRLTDVTDNVE